MQIEKRNNFSRSTKWSENLLFCNCIKTCKQLSIIQVRTKHLKYILKIVNANLKIEIIFKNDKMWIIPPLASAFLPYMFIYIFFKCKLFISPLITTNENRSK